MKSFTERYGLHADDPPIKIRHGDPGPFRDAIEVIASDARISLITTWEVIIEATEYVRFSRNESTEESAKKAIRECPWPLVYHTIERLYIVAARASQPTANLFEKNINIYMRKRGIGWKMVGGLIEVRGPEAYEIVVKDAATQLSAAGRNTASNEIEEAIKDISRLPNPDLTGAIQHAGAAIECLARNITGKPKATFGQLIKLSPDLFPKPLDEAAKKLWGYVSNYGRHVKEGHKAEVEEVMLVIGVIASFCAYLNKE